MTKTANSAGHLEPPGRIHGQVRRETDSQPLTGARVHIAQEGVIMDLQFTNTQGKFVSRLLFAGDYDIRVAADGYTPVVQPGVSVHLGHTTQVDLPLGTQQTEAVPDANG